MLLHLGEDWRQEEKGMTEDEMVGQHHRRDGHEFEQAPGAGDGQGSRSAAVHGVAKSQTWLSDRTDYIYCLHNAWSLIFKLIWFSKSSPGSTVAKNLPANAGGAVPGSGRPPGVGKDNPLQSLQYSCLENSMDREAWRATVHEVTKNRTWLSIHRHKLGKIGDDGTSLVV